MPTLGYSRAMETRVAPREGRWIAKPMPNRRIAYSVALGMCQALILIKLIYVIGTYDGRRPPGWIDWVQFFGIVAVFVVWIANELRIGRMTFADTRSMELPEGSSEYAAEVAVLVNGAEIGRDRGVVYFDEGTMGFVGRRTSFLLAAEDFVRPIGPTLSTWDEAWRALKLNAMGGKASLRVSPLVGQGRGYRRTLRRFMRAKAISTGPRQWPPLTPYRVPKGSEGAQLTEMSVSPTQRDKNPAEVVVRP